MVSIKQEDSNLLFHTSTDNMKLTFLISITKIDLVYCKLIYLLELFEYCRKGWTFHAKGIWASVDNNALISVIGSSNFSERFKFFFLIYLDH